MLSGGIVSYEGTAIGTLAPSAMVITFNSHATPSAVQALLRHLRFLNVLAAPLTDTRTVRIQISDGDSTIRTTVTKQINVVVPSVPPVIHDFAGDVTYQRSGSPVIIDGDASVTDPDSPNFDGGRLWLTPLDAQSGDRLGIRNQGTSVNQIGITGSDITYSGIVFGTLNASGNVVALNANADDAALTAFLRNLLYWNSTGNPSLATHTIRVQINDGESTIRTTATKQIIVTD